MKGVFLKYLCGNCNFNIDPSMPGSLEQTPVRGATNNVNVADEGLGDLSRHMREDDFEVPFCTFSDTKRRNYSFLIL